LQVKDGPKGENMFLVYRKYTSQNESSHSSIFNSNSPKIKNIIAESNHPFFIELRERMKKAEEARTSPAFKLRKTKCQTPIG